MTAALTQFLTLGYDGTTVESIAKEAGVSKVTVYKRYNDKFGVIGASLVQECERLRNEKVFKCEGPDIRRALVDFGLALNEFLARPELVSFERRLSAETENYPEICSAFFEAIYGDISSALSKVISDAELRGLLSVPDIPRAVEQLISLYRGLGHMELRFGHQAPKKQIRARVNGAVELFLRAYAI